MTDREQQGREYVSDVLGESWTEIAAALEPIGRACARWRDAQVRAAPEGGPGGPVPPWTEPCV